MESGPLRPAVMTSSSERRLADLFHEVQTISGISLFDILLVRRPEMIDSGVVNQDEFRNAYHRMSEIVADTKKFLRIEEHIVREVCSQGVEVSAIATYFPDISATDEDARKRAVDAVQNSVKTAIRLCRERNRRNIPCMRYPIVEIVCGSVVDRKSADPADAARRTVSPQDKKLEILFRSLEEVVRSVRSNHGGSFGIALELEPGETYVLNSLDTLNRIDDWLTSAETNRNAEGLHRHIGFNLDIAHMRIAGITDADLTTFKDRIVHAHISDHPGMHTHDQVVGSWTDYRNARGGYTAYWKLLNQRLASAATTDNIRPPFSGAVAIELEGCNRIAWIHDSVTRLRHSIMAAS